MADLKIADWEYLYAEQILNVYVDQLMSATGSFQKIVGLVSSYAFADGEGGVSDQCDAYAARMGTLTSQLNGLRKQLTGKAQSYVEEIDEADQFIYGAG